MRRCFSENRLDFGIDGGKLSGNNAPYLLYNASHKERILAKSFFVNGLLAAYCLGFFMENAPAKPLAGDTCCIEPGLADRDDIVFYGGFEGNGKFAVCEEQWENDWGIEWTNRCGEERAVSGDSALLHGTSLFLNYPEGESGPESTGMQFAVRFQWIESLPEQLFDSLYLRYYVKFLPGFDYRNGGKLPGLMGGDDSWLRSNFNFGDGTNGWTFRLMWSRGGMLTPYPYLPPGKYEYGSEAWNALRVRDTVLAPDRWHCVEQYIKINTVGREDGEVILWVDGKKLVERNDIVYRTVDNSTGRIGGIFFSSFHGGSGISYAPRNDSYAIFDGIVAAHNRIGPARVTGTMEPSVLSQLFVTPRDAVVAPGTSDTFHVVAYDQYDLPLDPVRLRWKVEGGGTMSDEGVFSAGASMGGPYEAVLEADYDGVTLRDTVTVLVFTVKLSGTLIGNGTPIPWARGYAAAVDGRTATFPDLEEAPDLYAGYDFSPEKMTVSHVRYWPRDDWAQRMVNRTVEVSDDGTTWRTIHTISKVPPEGTWTTAEISEPIAAKMVRYNGTGGYLNVGEIEFYGYGDIKIHTRDVIRRQGPVSMRMVDMNGRIVLRFPGSLPRTVTIVDAHGRNIGVCHSHDHRGFFEVRTTGGLSSGVYLVRHERGGVVMTARLYVW